MKAAVCALLLLAAPALGQEEVRLQPPGSVVFPVTDLGAKTAAPSALLSFDHARLAPGSRLRISVRAEGLDLGTGAPARISYAAHARGGIAFSASLRDTEFTPVFESDPLTLSGTVEIAWTLEPLRRFDRAGNHGVTLRWKVESIPGAAGRAVTGRPPRPPGVAAPLAPDERGVVSVGRHEGRGKLILVPAPPTPPPPPPPGWWRRRPRGLPEESRPEGYRGG